MYGPKYFLALIFGGMLGLASVAYAGPFEDGLAAANSGDYAAALRLWRPLAEQGNAIAQNNIGLLYENGRGVPKSDAEAAVWYRLAAEQGYAIAQNNLGVLYHHGRGLAQDSVEAAKWFRRAAEQGTAVAQNNLGVLYQQGRGVPQDNITAVKWFRLAAQQGNADAWYNLALMYPDEQVFQANWSSTVARFLARSVACGLLYLLVQRIFFHRRPTGYLRILAAGAVVLAVSTAVGGLVDAGDRRGPEFLSALVRYLAPTILVMALAAFWHRRSAGGTI